MRAIPTPQQWRTFSEEFQRQYVKDTRKRLTFSSGLADEPTCGWGELDRYGYWEYPCDWALRELKERFGSGVVQKKEA